MLELLDHARLQSLSAFNDYLAGISIDITKHDNYDSRRFNTGIPQAFGNEFRDFHIGLSAIHDKDHRDVPINPISGLGFGLGDAENLFAIDTFFGISSVSPWSGEGFAHDSYLGFKLHKMILSKSFIAAGCENLFSFGRDRGLLKSYFLTADQIYEFNSVSLILNLGVGTGRFYTSVFKSQFNVEYDDALTDLGVFGSFSFVINNNFALQLSKVVDSFSFSSSVMPLSIIGLRRLYFGFAIMDLRSNLDRDNLSVTIMYVNQF
ncbi:hypothetical protein [Fluviispira multicolorata]|uniref:Outer membrane protein n=1 Tax=Fluviispira multicolorata TaxID=2654512 RepID=A0A833JD11_9BACT|nr:hypothetical protein [Fluviispira multicolorata]KAB8030660.1 hypothetical protein GCL57_06710 [Fluviispira multicolorata]